MKKIDVVIVMGSQSDFGVMKEASKILKEFEVSHRCLVVSAHRTPHLLASSVESWEKDQVKVIIAGAGGAAHLPGMLASFSVLPVIGVPVMTSRLGGLDSLLSIVQMPKGVPVATVGVDNAANAGILAVEILSAIYAGTNSKNSQALINRLKRYKSKLREDVKKMQNKISKKTKSI